MQSNESGGIGGSTTFGEHLSTGEAKQCNANPFYADIRALSLENAQGKYRYKVWFGCQRQETVPAYRCSFWSFKASHLHAESFAIVDIWSGDKGDFQATRRNVLGASRGSRWDGWIAWVQAATDVGECLGNSLFNAKLAWHLLVCSTIGFLGWG